MIDCGREQAEFLYESGALHCKSGRPLRPGGSYLTALAVFCGAWRPGDRVIDVGCGRGSTLDYLRRCGLEAIGVDTSAETLQLAKELDETVSVIRASGDCLPLADASVDGILAECSLSLMPETSRALAEFHRVLRDDGRIVITDVYARNPDPPAQMDLHLASSVPGILEKARTIEQLAGAGFTLESWQDHSGVLTAFVAKFVFEYGSLDALWGGKGETPGRSDQIRRLRPGYALLVARKGKGRENDG
jgi:SAM-dependent methyltransferase